MPPQAYFQIIDQSREEIIVNGKRYSVGGGSGYTGSSIISVSGSDISIKAGDIVMNGSGINIGRGDIVMDGNGISVDGGDIVMDRNGISVGRGNIVMNQHGISMGGRMYSSGGSYSIGGGSGVVTVNNSRSSATVSSIYSVGGSSAGTHPSIIDNRGDHRNTTASGGGRAIAPSSKRRSSINIASTRPIARMKPSVVPAAYLERPASDTSGNGAQTVSNNGGEQANSTVDVAGEASVEELLHIQTQHTVRERYQTAFELTAAGVPCFERVERGSFHVNGVVSNTMAHFSVPRSQVPDVMGMAMGLFGYLQTVYPPATDARLVRQIHDVRDQMMKNTWKNPYNNDTKEEADDRYA